MLFFSGARGVSLQVYIPNEPALTLYRSLGFGEYGVEHEAVYLNGNCHDGIYMTLANEGIPLLVSEPLSVTPETPNPDNTAPS